MHLSNEENLSILEESKDKNFQNDLKLLSSGSKKMNLAEYLEFLNAVSKMGPQKNRSDKMIAYHTIVF